MRRAWYTGPYPERNSFRCIVFNGDKSRRSSCKAPTAEGAIAAAEEAIRLLNEIDEEPLNINLAIERYEVFLRDVKKNKEKSWRETVRRLRIFFRAQEHGGRLLVWWTAQRAAERYEEFAAGVSVDYHRNTLAECKTFLRWCTERPRSWLKSNPLADVKGQGERGHGKDQLRPDEGLRWRNKALELAQAGDEGALAALLLLDGGARPGEVVSRKVRDLVDGALFVLVDLDPEAGWTPKKKRSRRPLGPLPDALRELLVAQAQGKLPTAYLFPAAPRAGRPGGGPHDVGWVDDQVKRICRAAKVPERCAHSMRGLRTTLDLLEGLRPREAADRRGHEDERTTLTSYAAPGAAELAQQGRYLGLVSGGSFPPVSPAPEGGALPAKN